MTAVETTPKNAPAKAKGKRTVKNPTEATRTNAKAAITQLEALGAKLFKAQKPELITELTGIIASLRTFQGKL
jgi:hypothetical protein